MQEFRIDKNEAGQRLDKFLQKYFKEASCGFLFKMLRKKNITLNQKKAEGSERLKEGDVLRFFFSEETFQKFRGSQKQDLYLQAYHSLKNIQILYEDDHILLLNKPPGILSQRSDSGEASLNEWMIGYLLEENRLPPKQLETFRPSICNRLDRNTSGLVVCGKSLIGSQKMNRLLHQRELHKFYLTFVRGRMQEGFLAKGYLKKDERHNRVEFFSSLSDKDHYANEEDFVETGYTPLACYEEMTLLEVQLITGKPHQIRAHLAHLGHPIFGDPKYGDPSFNRCLLPFRPKWQLLHAYRIEFPSLESPLEGLSKRSFLAPEPEDFRRLKQLLKK